MSDIPSKKLERVTRRKEMLASFLLLKQPASLCLQRFLTASGNITEERTK